MTEEEKQEKYFKFGLIVGFIFLIIFAVFVLRNDLKQIYTTKQTLIEGNETEIFCYPAIYTPGYRHSVLDIYDNIYIQSKDFNISGNLVKVNNKYIFDKALCFKKPGNGNSIKKTFEVYNSSKQYGNYFKPFEKRTLDQRNEYFGNILKWIKKNPRKNIYCYDSIYKGENSGYITTWNYHKFNTSNIQIFRNDFNIYLKDENSKYYPVWNCFAEKVKRKGYKFRDEVKNKLNNPVKIFERKE